MRGTAFHKADFVYVTPTTNFEIQEVVVMKYIHSRLLLKNRTERGGT